MIPSHNVLFYRKYDSYIVVDTIIYVDATHALFSLFSLSNKLEEAAFTLLSTLSCVTVLQDVQFAALKGREYFWKF